MLDQRKLLAERIEDSLPETSDVQARRLDVDRETRAPTTAGVAAALVAPGQMKEEAADQ
ncbi:hypothetical protein [Streptomyces sp. NPDC002209]|uniref:hypothetical protein n=1 Tax=Streptomyces sp. NPDC002209 TaxID=3364638 RepID=UPI0036773BE4